MSLKQKEMESMIFKYGTAFQTDFRDGQIKPKVVTEFKERPTCYRQRPLPLKFLNTLQPWLKPNIPFDLFGKPKAIVGTKPGDIQARYEKEPDLLLEKIKHSRPRLVMTPAISIDDVNDPRCHEMLLDYAYSSTAQRAMTESASAFPANALRAPLPGVLSPPKPIKLPTLVPPYVSPEWRMDSVSWDSAQLRTYCEPGREFWLRGQRPQCTVCEETAKREARTKRLRQRQVRQ